jgi:hypothetical protein
MGVEIQPNDAGSEQHHFVVHLSLGILEVRTSA